MCASLFLCRICMSLLIVCYFSIICMSSRIRRLLTPKGMQPNISMALYYTYPWLSALCSTPRVSARNGDLVVEWRSEGDGRGVHGYRIQYRTDQSGWNPYGYVIIHSPFFDKWIHVMIAVNWFHMSETRRSIHKLSLACNEVTTTTCTFRYDIQKGNLKRADPKM